MFARDGIITTATGWPEPMRVMTFVQCFPVAFYQINTVMGIPYKLAAK